jgi:hypothetical protein
MGLLTGIHCWIEKDLVITTHPFKPMYDHTLFPTIYTILLSPHPSTHLNLKHFISERKKNEVGI